MIPKNLLEPALIILDSTIYFNYIEICLNTMNLVFITFYPIESTPAYATHPMLNDPHRSTPQW